MFVPNNSRIDFVELERRLELALQRAPTTRPAAADPVLTSPGAAGPSVAERGAAEPAVARDGGGRPLFHTVRHLLWALMHPRRLARRAIGAVFQAEHAYGEVQALEARAARQAAEMGRLASDLAAATRANGELQRSHAALAERLAAGLQGAAAHTDRAAGDAARRADETARVADEGARHSARLAEQLAMVRREVLFQQRRLTVLAASPESTASGDAAPRAAGLSNAAPRAAVVEGRLDSLYAAFEDVFRGTRADIKQRLSIYVDRLALAGAGQAGRPVLDIGCGRGEWLELLGERGIAAYGIDINATMVDRTAAMGLDVRHEGLVGHLGGLEDGCRSAITAFHVVEHLPLEVLVDMIDECLRVLAPGGVLLFETPNAETMRVGATTFYNDPTHRNPVLPAPLRFILQQRGFIEVEVLALHPFEQGLLVEDTDDARLLNRVLFGPQDYAIVARRP